MCATQCMWHTNVMSNMPTLEINFAQTRDMCSQSRCKTTLPASYKYKTCEKCWSISRLSKQKRKQEWDDKGLHHDQEQGTASNDTNLDKTDHIEAIYVPSGSESSEESNVSNKSKSQLWEGHLHLEIPSKILYIYQVCRQPLLHETPEGCV